MYYMKNGSNKGAWTLKGDKIMQVRLNTTNYQNQIYGKKNSDVNFGAFRIQELIAEDCIKSAAEQGGKLIPIPVNVNSIERIVYATEKENTNCISGKKQTTYITSRVKALFKKAENVNSVDEFKTKFANQINLEKQAALEKQAKLDEKLSGTGQRAEEETLEKREKAREKRERRRSII